MPRPPVTIQVSYCVKCDGENPPDLLAIPEEPCGCERTFAALGGVKAIPLKEHEDFVARFNLDKLEARAAAAVDAAYGSEGMNSTARFWVQKGIEGMRLAVAEQISAE